MSRQGVKQATMWVDNIEQGNVEAAEHVETRKRKIKCQSSRLMAYSFCNRW